ncbi:MAG: insulinase family protein [Ignavibacteriales bacterium]|nr:insulinase family protein [Ignavibacteriales bacterium]
MVHDLQIAQDVSAFQYSAKYDGVFFIIITTHQNSNLEKIKEETFKVIHQIMKEGITDLELERSVNSFKSSYIYSLQNLENMTNQINNYNCNLNEPNSIVFDIHRYTKLKKKENVDDAMKKYLSKNYVELHIVPKQT